MQKITKNNSMRKDVQFYSEGALLKAHLYVPENVSGSVPAILMCHGFAGVKELLLPGFADKFCNAGFVVLCFDYRGFGESEGDRGILQPALQQTDIRNALSFLYTIPEVDNTKIALWGTSFGGSNVVAVAAVDKRVKCVTAQLAFSNGERSILGAKSEEEKEKILATIQRSLEKKVTQNREMMMPINKFLTDEQSLAFFEKYKDSFPALHEKVPFLTMKEVIEYKSEELIKKVSVPVLIVGAENDIVNPMFESVQLFENANEPKELYTVKGATHYEVYEGKHLDEVSDKQISFFRKYLN